MEEEKIAEKVRAGLTREQAIQALERQAEHDSQRKKQPTKTEGSGRAGSQQPKEKKNL